MSKITAIEIPDTGDSSDVEVIEIMMEVGIRIDAGETLLTVESDKAAMDIPSQISGVVRDILVTTGDKVKQGDVFANIEMDEALDAEEHNDTTNDTLDVDLSEEIHGDTTSDTHVTIVATTPAEVSAPVPTATSQPQAGPSSRRLARKLGIDIFQVAGTGRRSRILKEDVEAHVKGLIAQRLSDSSSVTSPVLPDMSKFGPVHTEKLSKVEQVTSNNMQRAWREIPHAWLQQFVDITELDQNRKRLKAEVEGLTMTACIIKTLGLTLAQFPRFNSALDAPKQQLIFRDYINIGVAIDTPRGLLIAVIRDVDRLSIAAIGIELGRLSGLAREGKLQASDMQGASMTVSSLGAFGVDGLQPIVNWPEVAILGVARASVQAVYSDSLFVPRLMLPVTLGFDHRVINGADGARFLTHLKQLLSDPMRLMVVS